MSDDGRLLVVLGLAGVTGVALARGSRGVVRAGRTVDPVGIKSMTITYGVTTNASLARGSYADTGIWGRDGSFYSGMSTKKRLPHPSRTRWLFDPDGMDVPLRFSTSDTPADQRAVRAAAQFLLNQVDKEDGEWPESTTAPSLPTVESLLAGDEKLQIHRIKDGRGRYIRDTGRKQIGGSPIEAVDLEITLGTGWSYTDASQLIELVLGWHDAAAHLN